MYAINTIPNVFGIYTPGRHGISTTCRLLTETLLSHFNSLIHVLVIVRERLLTKEIDDLKSELNIKIDQLEVVIKSNSEVCSVENLL